MVLLQHGELRDVIDALGSEGAHLEELELPGLTLQSLHIKNARELLPWNKAEVYIFGVAVDATGELRTIPLGQERLDQRTDLALFRKLGEGEAVEYMGSGLPLVTPPVKGFLAIRLLIADNDSSAREAAQVIKAVGEAVATQEAVTLLTLSGLPHVAAIAAVTGKSLEAASIMMANNRDDVVEMFEGYFTPDDMQPEEPLVVSNPGASAVFKFV